MTTQGRDQVPTTLEGIGNLLARTNWGAQELYGVLKGCAARPASGDRPARPAERGVVPMLADVLAGLGKIADEVGELRREVEALRAQLAERPQVVPAAAAPSGTNGSGGAAGAFGYTDFIAESIVVTIDEKGKPAYKVKGGRWTQHGVRVWPEVLPLIGVSADNLKPGTTPFSAHVRAELSEDGKPKKVVGLVSSAVRALAA